MAQRLADEVGALDAPLPGQHRAEAVDDLVGEAVVLEGVAGRDPGALGGARHSYGKELDTRWVTVHDTALSRDEIAFVEDAGDTLHGQRDGLDSSFVFDVDRDYSKPENQPVRWLAEGRDASATIDAAGGGYGKNDGDNEITGLHVSNGDPGASGILGASVPKLFQGGWRWFYTQQHGDNPTYEVIPSPAYAGHDEH